MDQLSIFEELYPKYKITKPIRLIELFAGYGSQAFALEYLGVPFEHWKIAEWNYKSFDAYNRFHIADNTNYSAGKDREWLNKYILEKGVSADWNKPMTDKQVKKLSDHKARKIYNDIIATHNLVNIQNIKGKDLEITDNEHTYILCYSFPCQDLSNGGARKGLKKGSNTRSSLLWEVERILQECKVMGRLPDVLLMENVPMVHSVDNIEPFNDWMYELEKLGYTNYWQDLIATDYGIPQIRDRCFMVSMLGEWFYEYPQPIELKTKPKDMLEKDVDEKYYLSQKAIDYITRTTEDATVNIKEDNDYIEIKTGHGYFSGTIRSTDILSTIDASIDKQHIVLGIKIRNATKKGYLIAEDGDGIDISRRMKTHRGTVQKNVSQTLTTSGGETQGVLDGYTIRKLTPKECFRLQGVKDKDYAKIDDLNDGTKYHLAGDSIVVNVLMAIFKQML